MLKRPLSPLRSRTLPSLLAALLLALPAQGRNLIVNGNFEEEVEYWDLSVPPRPHGSAELDHDVLYRETPSLRLTAAAGKRLILQQEIKIEPNTVYRLTFLYRTESQLQEGEVPEGSVSDLAELQEDPGSTILRIPMRTPEGVLTNTQRHLCYVGNEPFASTFGEWKKKVLYVRTHPLARSCTLELNVRGNTIWLSSLEMEAAEPKGEEKILAFADSPKDPLYEELFSSEKRDTDVFLNWAYNLRSEGRFPYGLKLGIESIGEEELREAGRYQLTSFETSELTRKHHIPELAYLYSHQLYTASAKGRPAHLPLVHPEMQKLVLEATRKLTQRETSPWGLFYADEPYYRTTPPPDKRLEEDRAYWESVDKELKATGRHGIPNSLDEPFSWIAFRRWGDTQFFELLKKVHTEVKKKDPAIRIVGPDELAAGVPRDWELLAQTWDISTGQALPAWSPTYKRSVGYNTKLYADLTFKPMMTFVQVSAYDHASTPQMARELFSEVLRNGGESFWINGVEWYDREFNHPKWSAPDRWQAMLELIETVRKTPRLKLPKADCAILYSVDSEQSRATVQMTLKKSESASAYLYIGPDGAKSWFDFISERQVLTGSRPLKDYKVIYLPHARYLREEVVERLEKYVKEGGVLVCGDPEALSFSDTGENLSHWRERLFGVKRAGTLPLMPLKPVADAEGPNFTAQESYPLFEAPGKLIPLRGTRTLLAFEDGSPGLVLYPLGKGKALYFATNPFNVSSVSQPEWLSLFRAIQQWAGCALDQKIWRFTLPMTTPDATIPVTGKVSALTGNYMKMVSSAAFPLNHEVPEGSYSYDVAPKQEGSDGVPIPFSKGKLTDRARAFAHAIRGHKKMPKNHQAATVGDWSIHWDRADTPLSLTFDFKAETTLDRLVLYVAGEMPPLKVKAGEQALGEHPGVKLGEYDVKKIEVPLGGTHRKVQLQFEAGARFHLAEVEIWGEKPKALAVAQP